MAEVSKPYDVLVLGSGGREHAIAWKLLSCARVGRIFVAPGNAGTAWLHPVRVTNVSTIQDTDIEAICKFAVENKIDLVVPGSERSLVAGIADALKKSGVLCFGPSKAAAEIEGSKAFSKTLMKSLGVSTGEFRVFTDYESASDFVKKSKKRLVIKASGLAAGKGVIVPETIEEALDALRSVLVDRAFGAAGNEVVVEDFIDGEEVSVLAFTDGHTVAMMPAAQDHKRVFDGDKGPNTGGMGAYCPACPSFIKDQAAFMRKIEENVIKRVVDGLRRAGKPFVGILYAGIMVSKADGKPYVLEFNARFGDPETQVLLPLLKSDLLNIMLACCNGHLDSLKVEFHTSLSACTVVLASEGYPGPPLAKNCVFSYPPCPKDKPSDAQYFVAGAKCAEKGQAVAAGGRVIAVTGVGKTLREARDSAYNGVNCVLFNGAHYRRDIGFRGLAAETKSDASIDKEAEEAQKPGITYLDAGVSIDRGNTFVENIKSLASATRRAGADAEIGGFGGLFNLASAGFAAQDTLLVASTDGVGTKLLVAIEMEDYSGIGCDLVAMCVNDIVVQGAEPLFFLDYYACGTLNLEAATAVVAGVSRACVDSNCALIGGETAEMPGMYREGDFDTAGFAVGAVRRSEVLPKLDAICVGDVVLGIASSGVHSNGFSLVRKIVRRGQHALKSQAPFASEPITLGKALLTPTKLYVRQVLALTRGSMIKAAAHITGGGLLDNVPRVLPQSVGVDLDAAQWPRQPVFDWLMHEGGVTRDEMLRTFNCGIGMVLIVARDKVQAARLLVPELLVIGSVVAYDHDKETSCPQVTVRNFK